MILSRNGGGCLLCNCSMDHFAESAVHKQGRGNAGCSHPTGCKIIPRSWVLWLNTANLPQRALVTQLSLPIEICRRGARGSKIQADIYIYSTLFISSQPFLHARRFAEHWRLCSQSAGLWVRALLQQNRSDKPQIPVCAAWNWNIWSRNIFLTTSIYIRLVICSKIRSPPKMSKRWQKKMFCLHFCL